MAQAYRYDIFKTDTGFISTFMLADEDLIPKFREIQAQCNVNRAAATMMSKEERKEKLCPFCYGTLSLMENKDVSIEEFQSQMGTIIAASSETYDGRTALDRYVRMARETSELIQQAAAETKAPAH